MSESEKSVSVMDIFNLIKDAVSQNGPRISDSDLHTIAQALAAEDMVVVDRKRHERGEKLIEATDAIKRVLG